MKRIITTDPNALEEMKSEMNKREVAKNYINIELGDNIKNMSFEEIVEAVQEEYEIDVEEIADIMESDLSLNFSDDDSYKYMLNIRECPCCKKEVKRSEMNFTRDCHGIVFRLVCQKCWEELMAKGYDGEHYTEADECIDYDY